MSARFWGVVAPFMVLGIAAGTSAPSTTRYKIESVTEQVVDLSAMGQPNQTNSVTQLAIITVSLKDTTGGAVLHAVVDSIQTNAPLTDPSAVGKVKGTWIHGIVDGWGRTQIVKTSNDSSEIVVQLKNSLIRFFPVVKPGSNQGDSWIDTSRVETKTSQQALKTTTVTTYTHSGSDQRDGQSATKINGASTTSGAGTMENPMAGPMELELNDSATETFFVASDGRYLGGSAKSSGKSLVRAASVPQPIPVTITRNTTVTVIK